MFFKSYVVYFVISSLKLVNGKSFSIVLDTTLSMELELSAISNSIPDVAQILENKTNFENFILVPFNDADTILPTVTTRPDQLVNLLNHVRVGGGRECPEDSLSAIHKALQISQPESYIYLFTNAYAKYDHKLGDIENLCRETGSRVVIFLSGSGCKARDPGGVGYVDVYYKIARACSGTVFRIATVNLRKVFKYMKDTVNTDYNDVVNYDAFKGMLQFNFTVDSLTTDILIVLSGEYPVVQIADPNGYSPQLEKLVDTRQSLVIHLTNVRVGVYKVSAMSHEIAYLTFYKSNSLQFEYGFSTKSPQSLRETSLRPIPGWSNYILIKIQEEANVIINEIELEFIESNQKKTIILQKAACGGCYLAEILIEAQRKFKITVIGKDPNTYRDIKGSTKMIEVQNTNQEAKWAEPTSEIFKPDSNLIDYGTNATAICKVSGYPKPKIWWEDDKESTLPSEDVLLEIPSIYLSYVNIVEMSSNFTLYCKSQNAKGSDTSSMQLFVNRTYTFEIVEPPSDQAIEYGTSGKLFCKVNAYPEAKTKWYHNETAVEYSDNIEIDDEEKSLLIKNMTLDYVGNYACEVSNEANREMLSAVVTITGLETPEVGLPNEMIQKPDDWVDIECRIEKGNPIPEITWEYRPNNEEEFQMMMPNEVVVEDNKLKFSSIKIEHNGSYRCKAVNMIGEDSAVVDLKVQYAPKISNSNSSTVTVVEFETVELPCEVDAIPAATVKWEMYQDDVIINLDDRHITNEKNTHIFPAYKQDSGLYHCIAENSVGRSEKTITVNVLVRPYIEKPISKLVTVTTGSRVSFACNVLYGNPVPSTMWLFIGVDSSSIVLLRGTSNTTTLNLSNVSKANEGLYLCIAENNVGNDRIRIQLRVQ